MQIRVVMVIMGRVRDNPLYGRWNAMKQRCFNYTNPKYKRYGGKGVSICPEWEVFHNFEKWALSNGYEQGLTIDRINNDGNYEPSNCRWVNQKVQQNNRSNNKLIDYKGERYTLAQLSRKTGVMEGTISQRLDSGMNVNDAIANNLHMNYVIQGNENISLRSLCKEKELPYKTIHARVSRGWSIDRALNTPIRKGNYKANVRT